MYKVHLVVLLAVCFSFLHIDSTDGMFMFNLPGRFRHSTVQQPNSDHVNTRDGFDGMPPFSSFLNFFRQRSVTPYAHISETVKGTKDNKTNSFSTEHGAETVKFEHPKSNTFSNNSVIGRTGVNMPSTPASHPSEDFIERLAQPPFFERLFDPLSKISRFPFFNLRSTEKPNTTQNAHMGELNVNVTGNMTGIIATTPAPHHLQKFMGRFERPPFFERMFDPLRRLKRFRYFQSRYYDKPNNTRTTNLGNLNFNETGNTIVINLTTHAPYHNQKFIRRLHQSPFFERMFDPLSRLNRFQYFNSKLYKNLNSSQVANLNETEMAVLNSSFKNGNTNCIHIHFMYQYFYTLKINRSSLVCYMAFIALLIALVLLSLYIVHHHSEIEKENKKIRKEPIRKKKTINVIPLKV